MGRENYTRSVSGTLSTDGSGWLASPRKVTNDACSNQRTQNSTHC